MGTKIMTTEEYYELKRAQAKLMALEAGGVDNWQWYDEAIKEYNADIRDKPWSYDDE